MKVYNRQILNINSITYNVWYSDQFHRISLCIFLKSSDMICIYTLSKLISKGIVNFSVNVDLSFSFLLNSKNELEAIFNDDEQFLAFFGGFIDAEGSFFLTNDGRHHFSLTQYDEDILRKIQNKMLSYNIHFLIRIARKKYSYQQRNSQNVLKTYTQNDFMKHISLHRRNELLVFCNLIEKYLKHANRLRQLQTIRNYILSKIENNKG